MLYEDCDSILLSCSFLSIRSVRLLKAIRLIGPVRCLAINQFVESGCLYGMKPLSNCADLKETLVSLKQFKVSDEMSRNVFEIPTNVIHFTFVVWVSLTVYASVPLHAVYASVPLREQTLSRLKGVNVSCIHLSCQENCWWMVNSMGVSWCLSVTIAISLQS
jgi:hypothetical protein